jgi:hypothetical protein
MKLMLIALSVALGALLWDSPAAAADKTYLGTVIEIDQKANVLKVITNDGAMLEVLADGKAAKHLDKIPLNTMIDITVEVREGAKPLVKSWMMPSGKSPCRVFDGKMCAP